MSRFDLTGWTLPVDAGPFRFGPRPPQAPHAHLSDAELLGRTEALVLRIRDAWRAGEVADTRTVRLLARAARRPGVRGYFTPEELDALEVQP